MQLKGLDASRGVRSPSMQPQLGIGGLILLVIGPKHPKRVVMSICRRICIKWGLIGIKGVLIGIRGVLTSRTCVLICLRGVWMGSRCVLVGIECVLLSVQ